MRGHSSQHKMDKTIGICLAAGIFLLLFAFFFKEKDTRKQEDVTEPPETVEQHLADRISYEPTNLLLGQSLKDEMVYREDGTPITIGELGGDYTVLTFWGSWCEYCQEQMEQTETFAALADRYGNLSFVLVNKMDSEKESLEKAKQYLKEHGIRELCVYDQEMALYDKLGMQRIPTMLVLDRDARLLFSYTGVIRQASQFEAMMSYATQSYAEGTRDFLMQSMMNEQGGLQTEYAENERQQEHPSGDDVLSESQGLLMQYALIAEDQALFDQAYHYVKNHMQENGLAAWYVSEGEKAGSNALLDDLRIYQALLEAEERWGGYAKEAEKLGASIAAYNVSKDGLVDFYDFSSGKKGDQISLCYLDLNTVQELSENSSQPQMLSEAQHILENGYISDEFPFYYHSFSYKDNTYSASSLNMAEAMYTLYHLSKAGKLKESSEEWIVEQLRHGGIMARYTVTGEIVKGYGYESTGIYALAVLIGIQCGNDEMVTKALSRMEQMRIFDSASGYQGAFGNADGSGIYSFDQCVALLAYAELDQKYR